MRLEDKEKKEFSELKRRSQTALRRARDKESQIARIVGGDRRGKWLHTIRPGEEAGLAE